MKNKYFLIFSALFIALILGPQNLTAQDKFFDLNNGEVITGDFSVEFDVNVENKPPWAEVYFVPPASDDSASYAVCIHFGYDETNLFKIKYREGDGTWDYDNGYVEALVASNVDYTPFVGLDYHFKVEVFPGTLKHNIYVKATGDPDENYITVAEDAYWPHPYNQIGQLQEYTPGGVPINVKNVVVNINESNAIKWAFDTDGDLEGWALLYELSELTVSGGSLKGTVKNDDANSPAAFVDASGVDLNTNTHVKMRLKNSTSVTSGVIIFTSTSSVYPNIQMVPFDIDANSDFKDYVIDMSANEHWKDNLEYLGFIINGAESGSFDVDYIELGTNELVSAESIKLAQLKVYPNPVANSLHVSSDVNIDNVRVIALTGQVLKNISVRGERVADINVSDIKSGLYLVQVNFVDDCVVKQFIKH